MFQNSNYIKKITLKNCERDFITMAEITDPEIEDLNMPLPKLTVFLWPHPFVNEAIPVYFTDQLRATGMNLLKLIDDNY